jgi:hypothetical protein
MCVTQSVKTYHNIHLALLQSINTSLSLLPSFPLQFLVLLILCLPLFSPPYSSLLIHPHSFPISLSHPYFSFPPPSSSGADDQQSNSGNASYLTDAATPNLLYFALIHFTFSTVFSMYINICKSSYSIPISSLALIIFTSPHLFRYALTCPFSPLPSPRHLSPYLPPPPCFCFSLCHSSTPATSCLFYPVDKKMPPIRLSTRRKAELTGQVTDQHRIEVLISRVHCTHG